MNVDSMHRSLTRIDAALIKMRKVIEVIPASTDLRSELAKLLEGLELQTTFLAGAIRYDETYDEKETEQKKGIKGQIYPLER